MAMSFSRPSTLHAQKMKLRQRFTKKPSSPSTANVGSYAVPLTMLILFFAFPPVTSLAFRLFEQCTTFSDELGQSQAFLISSRKHYALACPSDELTDGAPPVYDRGTSSPQARGSGLAPIQKLFSR